MWIYTKDGFLSVVEDRDDGMGRWLYVRSREPIVFDELFPGHEIIELKDADYPFRIHILKIDFCEAIADLICEIDYPNFKDQVLKDSPYLFQTYSAVYGQTLKLENCHGNGSPIMGLVEN
jgi:hypothetical protein